MRLLQRAHQLPLLASHAVAGRLRERDTHGCGRIPHPHAERLPLPLRSLALAEAVVRNELAREPLVHGVSDVRARHRERRAA
jgi:hypothetical protein